MNRKVFYRLQEKQRKLKPLTSRQVLFHEPAAMKADKPFSSGPAIRHHFLHALRQGIFRVPVKKRTRFRIVEQQV